MTTKDISRALDLLPEKRLENEDAFLSAIGEVLRAGKKNGLFQDLSEQKVLEFGLKNGYIFSRKNVFFIASQRSLCQYLLLEFGEVEQINWQWSTPGPLSVHCSRFPDIRLDYHFRFNPLNRKAYGHSFGVYNELNGEGVKIVEEVAFTTVSLTECNLFSPEFKLSQEVLASIKAFTSVMR